MTGIEPRVFRMRSKRATLRHIDGLDIYGSSNFIGHTKIVQKSHIKYGFDNLASHPYCNILALF